MRRSEGDAWIKKELAVGLVLREQVLGEQVLRQGGMGMAFLRPARPLSPRGNRRTVPRPRKEPEGVCGAGAGTWARTTSGGHGPGGRVVQPADAAPGRAQLVRPHGLRPLRCRRRVPVPGDLGAAGRGRASLPAPAVRSVRRASGAGGSGPRRGAARDPPPAAFARD